MPIIILLSFTIFLKYFSISLLSLNIITCVFDSLEISFANFIVLYLEFFFSPAA